MESKVLNGVHHVQGCYDISIGIGFISDNFKKYRISGIRYFLRYPISDIKKYKKNKNTKVKFRNRQIVPSQQYIYMQSQ